MDLAGTGVRFQSVVSDERLEIAEIEREFHLGRKSVNLFVKSLFMGKYLQPESVTAP